MTSRSNGWTEAEVAILQDLAVRGFHVSQIAERLGRTYSAVRTKGHYIGLTFECDQRTPCGNWKRSPGLAEDRIGRCRVSVAADTGEDAMAFLRLLRRSVTQMRNQRIKGAA